MKPSQLFENIIINVASNKPSINPLASGDIFSTLSKYKPYKYMRSQKPKPREYTRLVIYSTTN